MDIDRLCIVKGLELKLEEIDKDIEEHTSYLEELHKVKKDMLKIIKEIKDGETSGKIN